jgi:DNA-binding MarR family transcriptional regulator
MENTQLQLSNQICFPLYSVSRLITKAYKPYLEKMGITYTQYLVLMVLWEDNNLTVNQIKEKLLLDTNTLSPLLKRMEKLEIIQRQRSLEDERSVIVQLTEKGKLFKEKAEPIPNELLKKLLNENIKLSEVLQLKELANQWIEILTEKN